MKTVAAASVLSLVASSFAHGAELPNIGDALRQAQPPKELDKPKIDIPDIQGPGQVIQTPEVRTDSKVLVRSVVVTGNSRLGHDEIRAMVSPYENKELSFKDMRGLADLITKAYRQKGYFVARAFIPKQSLSSQEGQLEIEVLEGRYGRFHVKNSSLVSDSRVLGIFDDIKGRGVISNEGLERAMLIANDTPGLKVSKASARQGAEGGTSDFDVVTEAGAPYGASVTADNYGSKYTGRYKVNAGLSVHSPFGYGDKLGLNVLASTTADLKNGKVFYNFPLMANGLRGELAASRTTYFLAEDFRALDALGNSNALEASLTYPAIKTKKETLDVALAFAHKRMKDEVRSISHVTRKASDVINLGLTYMKSHTLLGLNGTSDASLTLTHGDLAFKSLDDLLNDQSGARTNGHYSKLSGSLGRTLEFDKTRSLSVTLKFQKALGHKNLDGSEDFSLGGAYGVRAFPDGEYSAENGYLAQFEFFQALPKYKGVSHKVSAFADTGYAEMERSTVLTSGKQLSGVGVAYQASFQNFFVKAQVARVIGGERSETENKDTTRFLLQAGWSL